MVSASVRTAPQVSEGFRFRVGFEADVIWYMQRTLQQESSA